MADGNKKLPLPPPPPKGSPTAVSGSGGKLPPPPKKKYSTQPQEPTGETSGEPSAEEPKFTGVSTIETLTEQAPRETTFGLLPSQVDQQNLVEQQDLLNAQNSKIKVNKANSAIGWNTGGYYGLTPEERQEELDAISTQVVEPMTGSGLNQQEQMQVLENWKKTSENEILQEDIESYNQSQEFLPQEYEGVQGKPLDYDEYNVNYVLNNNILSPQQVEAHRLLTQADEETDPKNKAALYAKAKEIVGTGPLYNPDTGMFTGVETPETQEWQTEVEELTNQYRQTPKDQLQELFNRKAAVYKKMESEYMEVFKQLREQQRVSGGAPLPPGVQPTEGMGEVTQDVTLQRQLDNLREARKDLEAISRVYLLREDPTQYDTGFWDNLGSAIKESVPNSTFLGVLEPLLDQNLNEVQMQDMFNTFAQLEGIQLTEEQKEGLEKTFTEKLGGTIGGSVPSMVDIGISFALLRGAGSATGLTNLARNYYTAIGAKYGQNAAKVARMIGNTVESGIAFEGGNQSFATGVGEALGENLGQKIFKTLGGKYGRLGNYLAGFAGGSTTEFLAEYVGEFSDLVLNSGLEIDEATREVLGGDDWLDKAALTYTMTAMFSGVSNLNTLMNIDNALDAQENLTDEQKQAHELVKQKISEVEGQVEQTLTDQGETTTEDTDAPTEVTETEVTEVETEVEPQVEETEVEIEATAPETTEQPQAETKSPSLETVDGRPTQEELENKVAEAQAEVDSFRGEGGEVVDIEGFKEAQRKLNSAKENARRGDTYGSGQQLPIKKRTDTGFNTRFRVVTGLEAKAEEKRIESLIQQIIDGKRTLEEVMELIGQRNAYNTNEMGLLKSYIRDRTTNAPEVGNNKQSFSSWRKGEFDSGTGPNTETTKPADGGRAETEVTPEATPEEQITETRLEPDSGEPLLFVNRLNKEDYRRLFRGYGMTNQEIDEVYENRNQEDTRSSPQRIVDEMIAAFPENTVKFSEAIDVDNKHISPLIKQYSPTAYMYKGTPQEIEYLEGLKNSGYIPMHIDAFMEGNTVALYPSTGTSIWINEGRMNEVGSDLDTDVIAHELSHMFTVSTLESSNEYLQPFQVDFKESINRIFNRLKNNPFKDGKSLSNYYGFKNSSEFVAEYISNPSFREIVNNRERSIITVIKDFISKILGRNIDNIEEVFDNYFYNLSNKTKQEPDAIQVESTTEEMLRPETQGEGEGVELQEVEQQDQPEVTTQEETEVTTVEPTEQPAQVKQPTEPQEVEITPDLVLTKTDEGTQLINRKTGKPADSKTRKKYARQIIASNPNQFLQRNVDREQITNPQDYVEEVLATDNATAADLMDAYLTARSLEGDTSGIGQTKQDKIAELLETYGITEENFANIGDRNMLDDSRRRSFIKKDAGDIDVLLETDEYSDITTEDIVEFINDYKSITDYKQQQKRPNYAYDIADKFRKLTGLPISESTIENYLEQIEGVEQGIVNEIIYGQPLTEEEVEQRFEESTRATQSELGQRTDTDETGSGQVQEGVRAEEVTEPTAEQTEGVPEPPPPTETKGDKPISESQTARKLVDDKTIAPEVRQAVEKDMLDYQVRPMREVEAEAQAIVAEYGVEEAFNRAKTKDIPDDLRVYLTSVAFRYFNDNKQYDKAIDAADYYVELGKNQARGLNAFKLHSQLDLEGFIVMSSKIDAKSLELIRKQNQGLFNALEKADRVARKRSAKKASQMDKTQQVTIKAMGMTKSQIDEGLANAKNKFKEALEKAKKSRQTMGIDPTEQTKAQALADREVVDALLEVGRLLMAKGIVNFKRWAKALRKELDISPDDITDEQLRLLYENEPLNEAGTTLREISETAQIEKMVEDYLTKSPKPTTEGLSKVFQDAGFPKESADKISKSVQQKFEKLVEKEVLDIFRKETEGITSFLRPAKKKKLQELVKANATSGFRALENAIKSYLEEGSANKKLDIEKLQELEAKRKATPEGSLRDEVTRQMLMEIWKTKRTNLMDLGVALMYSGMLSGPSTQMKNIVYNFMNAGGNYASTTLYQAINNRNPTFAWRGFTALMRGYGKGMYEAIGVFLGGSKRQQFKFEADEKVLEMTEFMGKRLNPFNYYKYVPRFMAAMDTFAAEGLYELEMQALAENQIMEERPEIKKGSKEFKEAVNDLLYNSSDSYANAIIQAKQDVDLFWKNMFGKEPKTAKEKTKYKSYVKRRANEIVDNSRPAPMSNYSYQSAAEGTYNFEPRGYVGWFANWIMQGKRKDPTKMLTLIVPFVRTIANVTNEALNYFPPIGYYRASGLDAKHLPKNVNPAIRQTSYERGKVFWKASMGTFFMFTTAALAASAMEDDEDNPWFSITAKGPPQWKDKKNWLESNMEYSIKINGTSYSYQGSPLVAPLSFIGAYFDSIKYGKLTPEESSDRLALIWRNLDFYKEGTRGLVTSTMDFSFIDGVGGFFDAVEKIREGRADFDPLTVGLESAVVEPAKRILVPNLFRQATDVFDPTIYQADGIKEEILRGVPVIEGVYLKPLLNAFGEPVKKKGIPFVNSFAVGENSDSVWRFVSDYNVKIPGYGKPTHNGTPFTDEQHYRYIELAGRELKTRISANMSELMRMDKKQRQDRVEQYSKQAKDNAKWKVVGGGTGTMY